jgi:hypothetical protein
VKGELQAQVLRVAGPLEKKFVITYVNCRVLGWSATATGIRTSRSGEERANDEREANKTQKGTEFSQWRKVRHHLGHRIVFRLDG